MKVKLEMMMMTRRRRRRRKRRGNENYNNIYIVSRAVFIRDNVHPALFSQNREVARTENNTI
jgi:hypothetical protein